MLGLASCCKERPKYWGEQIGNNISCCSYLLQKKISCKLEKLAARHFAERMILFNLNFSMMQIWWLENIELACVVGMRKWQFNVK